MLRPHAPPCMGMRLCDSLFFTIIILITTCPLPCHKVCFTVQLFTKNVSLANSICFYAQQDTLHSHQFYEESDMNEIKYEVC